MLNKYTVVTNTPKARAHIEKHAKDIQTCIHNALDSPIFNLIDTQMIEIITLSDEGSVLGNRVLRQESSGGSYDRSEIYIC